MRFRRLVLACAVVVVAGLSPAPAFGDPAEPTTASEALRQYHELTRQTELVNEDLQQAKEDLKARQADLVKANADLGRAKHMVEEAARREGEFRGQVDRLADASFQGARFTQLSALFSGTGPQDFLDRSAALDVLAAHSAEVLDRMQGAVTEAEQGRALASSAQRRAATATTTAQNLVNRITEKQRALTAKVDRMRDAYTRLSAADRDALHGDDYDPTTFVAPPGAAGKAMEVALAQVGKPYVWGATGPDSFDCSGLVMYSYAHAGVRLPRTSRQQFLVGTPVSRDQLQPGDLVFFGGSPATIHHVVMYIGDGKVVHASTTGVPVKVAPLATASGDYYGAKRVVSG